MTVHPPKVVDLDRDEIVRQTESLAEELTAWRKRPDGALDPGGALIRVFAHLTDLLVERLNRAPDKNLLAFLDLIGTQPRPPRPARTPVTFVLAEGSATDAFVPLGTQIAAPAEDAEQEVVFETQDDLTVTGAQLTEVFVREPGVDRYAVCVAGGVTERHGTFSPFEGDRPIEHSLYIARDDVMMQGGSKDVTLRFTTRDPDRLATLPLVWEVWDGSAWQELEETRREVEGAVWAVTFPDMPAPAPVDVVGVTAGWLRARLRVPLPPSNSPSEVAEGSSEPTGDPSKVTRLGLQPDGAVAATIEVPRGSEFHPFGVEESPSVFYLRADEPFLRSGAKVELRFDLSSEGVGTNDLKLSWDYWDGGKFVSLGHSTPNLDAGSGEGTLVDDTGAFTRSGIVRFDTPSGWRARRIKRREGYWLRISVVTGNYGLGEGLRPPQVASTLLDYSWQLPTVSGVGLLASVHRRDLGPEKLVSNVVELDPTKDFYPFGERPTFNDTFYIGSHEALSMIGAEVTVSIVLSPFEVKADGVKLVWETWRGDRWSSLSNAEGHGFSDGTENLTKSGDVVFRVPNDIVETTVLGLASFWVRVRIVAGSYGTDAHFALDDRVGPPRFRIPLTLNPSSYRPPSIAELRLSYVHENEGAPGQLWRVSDFQAKDVTAYGETGFAPFVPTRDTRPALYLGFDRPFTNRSVTLFSTVEGYLVSDPDARLSQSARRGATRVAWEYSSPTGWMALGARDETAGFSVQGTTSFLGPSDFVVRREFGLERFWIRARWSGGEFAPLPRVGSVLPNTVWAVQARAIRQETLGSGTGDPGLTLSLVAPPVLPGARIEVREIDSPPLDEDTDALSPTSGAADTRAGWVCWEESVDFRTSQPQDRHYVLDHLTGTIRFGDGKRGMIPPRGLGNIRADYRTGGGARGNLAAGRVVELKSTIPYVESVLQPQPAVGGADAETLDQLRERGPKRLRHRGRAVAPRDFEDLAREASPEVARALAIPAHDRTTAGRVRLIIVPETKDAQPIPSPELLRTVEDYVRHRSAPTIDLWVAGPEWVRVTVEAKLTPKSLDGLEELEASAYDGLYRFIHPLMGGADGTGWSFGRRPHKSDLYALLESIPRVDYVRELDVGEETIGPPSDRFLVFSGAHRVSLTSPLEES